MNRLKWIYPAALLAALASGPAFADGHWHGGGHWHGSVGVVIGPGWYGPPAYYPYYYPPYYSPYYYPPVVAVPTSPPVYVERSAGAPASGYWYYCEGSRAYYPQVKECPEGWQQVSPQPVR